MDNQHNLQGDNSQLSSTDEPDSVLPQVQQPADDQQIAPPMPPQISASQSSQVPGSSVPVPYQQNVESALLPMPEDAADNDLIEKEWVLKAKQIVEHTAEDPFSQQEELSKMKADYLKKRYNKDLGAA